jgi:hypothetical protein
LCFMKVLGFELRALYLLSRCSIASHASRPFLLWLFWRHCLTFSSGWPGPWSTYFMLSTIAGMTGACTLSQIFSVEKGVSLTFLPQLARNWSFYQSQPPVSLGMTGVLHCVQQWLTWDFLNSLLGWPGTTIISITANQIAKITQVSQRHLASFVFLKTGPIL